MLLSAIEHLARFVSRHAMMAFTAYPPGTRAKGAVNFLQVAARTRLRSRLVCDVALQLQCTQAALVSCGSIAGSCGYHSRVRL